MIGLEKNISTFSSSTAYFVIVVICFVNCLHMFKHATCMYSNFISCLLFCSGP